MRLAYVAALALALSGCTIYFGDDDSGDDDECLGPPAEELRDPATGQCDFYGGGCDPQPLVDLDWASCAACEGLDQVTCELTAGCRAILVDTCPECDALILEYAACWGIAPSGPADGLCGGLDAYGCSQHENCSAVHVALTDNAIGDFEFCWDEVQPTPFACGDLTCAVGEYCNIIYPGVPDAPVQYSCADLPAACADPTTACECLSESGVCANGCSFDAAGNLTASCYLP